MTHSVGTNVDDKVSELPQAYLSHPITPLTKDDWARLSEEIKVVRSVCEDLQVRVHDPIEITDSLHVRLMEAAEIYERDMVALKKSNMLIIHCGYGTLSMGVLHEFFTAVNTHIPVVLLISAAEEPRISPWVLGLDVLRYDVRFQNESDLVTDLAGAIRLALGLTELRREPSSSLVRAISRINVALLEYLKVHPESLYTLKPRQFEELVAEMLASFGWEVELTSETNDGGYDIFAVAKDIVSGVNVAFLVECKKYQPENKVGVEIVRALYGTKSSFPGAHAILATTSFFTRGAQKFKASRYDLHLRDFEGILKWLDEYHPNSEGTLYIKESGVRNL